MSVLSEQEQIEIMENAGEEWCTAFQELMAKELEQIEQMASIDKSVLHVDARIYTHSGTSIRVNFAQNSQWTTFVQDGRRVGVVVGWPESENPELTEPWASLVRAYFEPGDMKRSSNTPMGCIVHIQTLMQVLHLAGGIDMNKTREGIAELCSYFQKTRKEWK